MSTTALRQERAAIVREMRQCLDSSDPITQQRWRDLDVQQEALKLQIERSERAAAMGELETEMSSVHGDPQRPAIFSGFGENGEARDGVTGTPEYLAAFRTFVKTGRRPEFTLTGAEQRTYSGLSDAADGVLIPAGFMRELEVRLKAYGQMRDACRRIVTASGNPLPWPKMDDTANQGTWLAEAAPVNQTNPAYSNLTLGANLLSSDQVLISVQLLQDSAFSMESELGQAFGTRLGRGTNAAFTNGNGSGQPYGIIPALVAATGRSITAVGSAGNTGGSEDGSTSIGTDDFASLIAGVDVAYRADPSCAFMANQATWDTLRKLKDKYGRPIWEVSLAQGNPDKIAGYKFFYNNALPTVAASAVGTVVFGAFSKYIIRDVLGMTLVRYNELYMPQHQIGFEMFLRCDGQLLQPNGFVYLVHPSS